MTRKIIGFIVVCALGTLSHFLYEWLNKSPFIGAFCAVNESVWEHLKLLFFPVAFYALIEYFISRETEVFTIALISLILGLITIPVFYYTYTGALGLNADWFNILIFFISAAIVFTAQYKLEKLTVNLNPYLSVVLLTTIAILFMVLTFYPLKIPLFQDPSTLKYGI